MRAAKDAGQCIIIISGNRVELVVVTARAAERHTEKRSANRLDLLVHHFHPQQFLVLQLVVVRTQRQKAGGDKAFVLLLASACWHQVTRNLFANELVERLVVVEGVDHVVAKSPCVLEHQTPPTAAALGKTRHVQPVPPPCLTELR